MTTVSLQRFLRFWIFCVKFFPSETYATCYLPNGTDVNGPLPSNVYQPCGGGDQVSMCCALNREARDRCRSDGLCQSSWDGNIWRDSCTDPSWKSPACIKLCDHGIGHYVVGVDINLAGDHSTITVCQNGSYCCGNGTLGERCCENKKGAFLVDGVATNVTSLEPISTSTTTYVSVTKVSSLSSSSTSRTSFSSAASFKPISTFTTTEIAATKATSLFSSSTSLTSVVSASPISKSSSTDHTDAIAGEIVGGVVIIVLGVGLFSILRRQKLKHPQNDKKSTKGGERSLVLYKASSSDIIHELNAHQITELPGGRMDHEMQ